MGPAPPFIFNSFLFWGLLLGSGPFVGTTKGWFHFTVWRGSWGLWGGSRPAQNIPAEVVLRSGQVKFLPAVTPGLWLKNRGTQAGAAQPRGLCKHGRCSQVGLRGPWRGGGSGGQGTAFGVARGRCPWERGVWGRGGRAPNPETRRDREKDRRTGREGDRVTGRDGERLRQREMERETDRHTENPKDGALQAAQGRLGWARARARGRQRAAGGGPGPGARTGWASVTASASLCCTSEACW